MKKGLNYYLSYISPEKIQVRKYTRYLNVKKELSCLTDDELSCHYVTTNVAFEHMKRIVTVCYILFFFSIVLIIQSLKKSIVHYSLSFTMKDYFIENQEVINYASMYLSLIIFILISLTTVFYLCTLLSDMKKLHRKLLMIELVLQNKKQ